MDKQVAIDALRQLADAYSFPPGYDGIEIVVEASKDSARVFAKEREVMDKLLAQTRKVKAAQRQLLKSGFDVPDEWLTAKVIPTLESRYTAKDDCWVAVTKPLDYAELRRIEKDMRAAIMRLECAPDTGGKWSEPPPAERAEMAPANLQPPSLGVSLRDAAEILTDQDHKQAAEIVNRWRKQRNPKRPKPIGVDPKHSQRKLYAPAALCEWVKKIEGPDLCSQYSLSQRLRDKARPAVFK